MIHNVSPVWKLPREGKEWIGPLTVTMNGVPATDYKVQLVRDGERPVPEDWADPILDSGNYGIVVGPNLIPGKYSIWVRRTTALEDVHLDDVGVVIIT